MPQLDEVRKNRIIYFSYYVSALPWFNVQILHKLYFNLFRKFDGLRIDNLPDPEIVIEKTRYSFEVRTTTCTDFLLAPGVKRIGYNSFVLEDELKAALRKVLSKYPPILDWMGEFMVALGRGNQNDFPNAIYREAYRISGTLILAPQNAIYEISNHIFQQVHQKTGRVEKEEAISYHLMLLERKEIGTEFQGIKNLLEAYQDILDNKEEKAIEKLRKSEFRGMDMLLGAYDYLLKGKEYEAIEKLNELRYSNNIKGDSINIPLRPNFQRALLRSLGREQLYGALERLTSFICLITVNNEAVGTGTILPEGILLTSNLAIPDVQTAAEATIIFFQRISIQMKILRIIICLRILVQLDMNYALLLRHCLKQEGSHI